MEDQQRYQRVKMVSLINLLGNIVLTLLKGMIGFLANSTALIADATNSASDIVGTLILFQGLKIAHRPPDENHPYGHHKAEPITAKLLAIILVITALGIGYEAVKILLGDVVEPPGMAAVYTAIISILIKQGMYLYTIRVGKAINSDAVIADAMNHRSDVFSSSATLAGIAGAIWGFPFLDPLAGIFVAALILKTGIQIYAQAVNVLMDAAPAPETLASIRSVAEKVEGVIEIQDIKVRQYGSYYQVDLKLCVDPQITVEAGHNIAAQVKASIKDSNAAIQDVLIHVNPHHPEK